jgi:hypothetical protein
MIGAGGYVTAEAMLGEFVANAVTQLAGELVATTTGDAPDPGPRLVPRDLRLWLARLRLLEGVPFGQLVAHPDLLPPESIRFFHVDRGWTDVLIEGALSVGTVTTADRSALEELYGVVRDEVDEAERLVRLPGWEPGAAVPSGPAGPVTGFLLRSRMVSGWPALHVRGYAADNLALPTPIDDDDVGEEHDDVLGKLPLLRLERLAPGVLLALFDGLPQVVHIEEPRAGVQFGVDEQDGAGGVTGVVRLRDLATGEYVEPARTAPVRFRRDAPGVVHLAATAGEMVEAMFGTGSTRRLDAAEFALQMLQFPYRAVFGDRTLAGGTALAPGATFAPTVGLPVLARQFRGERP